MYRLITSVRIAFIALLLCAASGSVRAQGYDDAYGDNQASYQQFYDGLAPYGEWVNDPQYGYVWVPDAGDDFRPYYSNGYWVNSEYGNTWVSDYSWGWAPFHYGRWTYSSYYGWLWVPGNQWGPAWVSWRSGGGSYGWAPLGPGISVNVGLGSGYYVPDYWWTFTPQQYILSPQFHNYCYGPRYNQQYMHQTTIINNTYVHNNNTYITGPRRQDMEHVIGRPIQQVAINNTRRPDRTQLQGNNLSIYRPAIAESRPRATERPKTFSPARQPIADAANSPREAGINRGGMQHTPGYDRGVMQQNQAQPVQQQGGQPTRNTWGARPQQPVQERPRVDPVMQAPRQQQQPAQPQPVQQQPMQRPREWNNNINRAPQQPMQQVQQPQRAERPAFNRSAEMQQRPQPAVQQPQRVEQPRMEAPRQAPPASTSERPGGGGESGRPARR